MASNSEAKNSTSGEYEEDSMSMVDVLHEEQQLEEDADAILGGSDSNQCTFVKGYVQRQALYACATCIKEDMEPAGVCLACSLECHEGHTLYELYTKRNFCCDCGNQKFGENKCKLNPDKTSLNEKNQYSQNFHGLYCTCHRPYPDPEDSIDDEMIQCNLCEDWYHSRHLGGELPDTDYEEMICDGCSVRCDFLYTYTQLYPQLYKSSATVVKSGETTDVVNVTAEPSDPAEQSSKVTTLTNPAAKESDESEVSSNKDDSHSSTSDSPPQDKPCDPEITAQDKNNETDSKTETSTESKDKEQKPGEESEKPSQSCKLEILRQQATKHVSIGATFWPDNWRSKLCTCSACKAMYADLKVSFLCDIGDTLRVYTAKGRGERPSRYEKGMQALQNMERTKQVEVLTEFNTMKDALTDYLKKFAENKKTVRKEDIEAFYENLRANKRPRLEMQHFCR